ncbi:MAG TPA: redoxin domain-containing protein [Myxococcota bacterium]|nr:redoxin domain-containing protein [Myxococcota bacterium]
MKAEFDSVDTDVLGISKDSLLSHHRFVARHGLTTPLLSDPDFAVHVAYGTWVEKKNFGVTHWGAQRTTFLIDEDGVIERVWRKVRVKGHVDEVLEAARS